MFGALDLLPWDIAQALRTRRYKRGALVFLHGKAEGVSGGSPYASLLAAKAGRLWVAERRDTSGLHPVPLPEGEVVVERDRPTWSSNPTLSYEVEGRTIRISAPAADWDLLLRVLGVEPVR